MFTSLALLRWPGTEPEAPLRRACPSHHTPPPTGSSPPRVAPRSGRPKQCARSLPAHSSLYAHVHPLPHRCHRPGAGTLPPAGRTLPAACFCNSIVLAHSQAHSLLWLPSCCCSSGHRAENIYNHPPQRNPPQPRVQTSKRTCWGAGRCFRVYSRSPNGSPKHQLAL